MNAREKFELIDGIKIDFYRTGFIPLTSIFFKGRRKTMRGLEEQLMIAAYKERCQIFDPSEHDFTSSQVLKVTTVDGSYLWFAFTPEWIEIGSQAIF